jgi:hypothetical protein
MICILYNRSSFSQFVFLGFVFFVACFVACFFFLKQIFHDHVLKAIFEIRV